MGNTETSIIEKKEIKIEKAAEFSHNCYYCPEQGWLSADVDVYIPLFSDPEENGIWLFGDTLVGNINDQTNKKVIQAFIRNSVGVVRGDPMTNKSSSTYHWSSQHNISNAMSFFLHPKEPEYWYWVVNGISFPNEDNTDSTLFLFAFELKKAPNKPIGLDFKVERFLSFKFESSKHDLLLNLENPQFTISEIPRQNSTNWISAMVFNQTDKNLYMFGSKPTGLTNQAVLSRISKKDLMSEDWSNVEYLYRNNTFLPSTIIDTKNLKPLFNNIPQETIFYKIPKINKWILLFGEFGTPNVYMRVSDNLIGPWSDQIKIYTLPKPYNDMEKYILTAIKIQERFIVKENEIIFTYVINSFSWDKLVGIGIYFPNWMKLTINV
ncbi:hypothetical protein M0813_03375 [Anaeramoeba flamelloides]|uniref:DUF4185 domain-containing protein n=1 Tax=Anaeramoeba flamelloides TaxID=1746091 RepID=A0ABQ8Y057_9EUKA|nr:hypothetical protein M0813_03375 [Anaeramoeba flamelloides]